MSQKRIHKIFMLKKKAEAEMHGEVVSTVVMGSGAECPHCHSMNLIHNNKYPRFRRATLLKKAAIIFMSKCLSCGMLFDEPIRLKDPWVLFRFEKGYAAYNLKEKAK